MPMTEGWSGERSDNEMFFIVRSTTGGDACARGYAVGGGPIYESAQVEEDPQVLKER
jgi:hypothetical protein